MKRILPLMIFAFLLSFSACAEGLVSAPVSSGVPAVSAAPAPTPSPEQVKTIAVFGAEEAGAFLAGIQDAAAQTDIEILPVSGGIPALASFAPEGPAAAIVYLSDAQQTIPEASVPVYAFAAAGQSVPSGTPYLGYDDSDAIKIALESALAYPPHLAPVRMIGLFSGEGSAAYALWSAAKVDARVFAKQEFFADVSEVPVADWLNEAFSRYYPGMLDAVYAETGALAVVAAECLAALGRDDIEVFSAGTDAQSMQKLSPIFVCAVGPNLQDAGARCYAEAAKLLAGDAAQSGILLPESIWYQQNP